MSYLKQKTTLLINALADKTLHTFLQGGGKKDWPFIALYDTLFDTLDSDKEEVVDLIVEEDMKETISLAISHALNFLSSLACADLPKALVDVKCFCEAGLSLSQTNHSWTDGEIKVQV